MTFGVIVGLILLPFALALMAATNKAHHEETGRKRFEAIPAALDRVVAKKVSKEYPPDVGLVIYVNLNCYGAYVDEGIPILRRHSAPAKDKFKSVFILWEGTLYKLWEDGESASDQWNYARPDDT